MEFYDYSIKLDDGTNKKRQTLKDENGKDLKFLSLIGAMNYMSLQGWELVEKRTVVRGGAFEGLGDVDTKIYYIFSKDASDDELREVMDNSYKQ